jgi:hypothetical protein
LPVTVTVTGAEPATAWTGDIAVTDGTGLIEASTVNVGLVAARRNPLSTNNRNSYGPAVGGAVTVHVRLVTPAPTYVDCR